MSAALSFQTIFALIPILVLGLLVAKQVGALDDSKESLRAFLQSTGMSIIYATDAIDNKDSTSPDAQKRRQSAADYIEQMVDSVETKLSLQRIGPIGAFLFIWTALSLITTMEDSL